MNRNILVLAIISALFLQSCKSTRHAKTVVNTPTPVASAVDSPSADELILQAIQQRSNFDWFSASFSGSIDLDGDKNNIGGQIRIKNGEQIWMNITAMGGFIPVARLKITRDSVFLHNQIERTCTIRSLSFFKELTGVEFSYQMLQDILIGNYFLPEPKGHYSYEISDGNYAFFGDQSIEEITFDFVLHHAYYKFLSLAVRDEKNRSVCINYEDYTLFNDALYPQKLSVQMKEPKPAELLLNYSKIQINVPQSLPFSIPESVKKI